MTLDEAKNNLHIYFEEACRILRIDYKHIIFVYEHTGKRFRTINNTCEVEGDIVFINEDWLSRVLLDDFLYDLQYQMYHEARHFYQQKVIADYRDRGVSSELGTTISQWENEFKNYKRNEGTPETQKDNANQKVEIDANAFAIVLLSSKGKEARAPEEQWEETERRASEIFKDLHRLGQL